MLKTLDQFSKFGLPLEVTEFEITLQNGKDPAQRRYQADYTRDYLTAVFSYPSIRAILFQDFWQPGAWQYEGASCFFNEDWSENPYGKVYEDLVLHQWRTQTAGKTNMAGACRARLSRRLCYHGDSRRQNEDDEHDTRQGQNDSAGAVVEKP